MNAFKDVLREMKLVQPEPQPIIPGYTSNTIIRSHYAELLTLIEAGQIGDAKEWLRGAVEILEG